jgi:hypothetical protein
MRNAMPWPKDARDCVAALISAQFPHWAHRGIFSERPNLKLRAKASKCGLDDEVFGDLEATSCGAARSLLPNPWSRGQAF